MSHPEPTKPDLFASPVRGGDSLGSNRRTDSFRFTGVVPLERTIDHLGPMAPTVETVVQTLEVIAGTDTTDGIKLDTRQPDGVEAGSYAAAAADDPEGLSIAFLDEGFGWEFSDSVVDETVRETQAGFEACGVSVDHISIPRHRQSMAIWGAIATQGGARLLQEGSVGTNQKGWSWPQLARVRDSFQEARPRDLPPTVIRSLLAAAFLKSDGRMGVSD